MTIFTLVVILFLLIINGFYVASEFGAVGARRSRIQQLAENGNKMAGYIFPILKEPSRLIRYLAVTQIGITLASLALGAYGQATLAVYFTPIFKSWGNLQDTVAHSVSVIIVLIVLTVLQMLIGEMVPRALALQYPTQTAIYTVIPMKWSIWLFSMFSFILNASGNFVLKILKIPQTSHHHIHSPEEIDLLIVESRDGGLLEPDEQYRLHKALQLSMRTARQLMIPRLHMKAIDIDTPIEEIIEDIIKSPYSRLPVYKDSLDNIIGILHIKDIVMKYTENETISDIKPFLRPILFVPENVTAERLLAFLKENRSHYAIVMDEFGGVSGMVSLEDFMQEVLGEIGDEFKEGQARPEKLPDGRVRLPGMMRLDEAEPWIGILWEGDADTVAGRVIESLGHLPLAGERVSIDGVEVEIEKISKRAITSILAKPVNPV